MNRYFIAAIFILAVPFLQAAEMQDVSMGFSAWKMLASLVFVIAFIPACLWVMKRFQLAQMKLGQSEIKIISAQSLGTKEKLMLVEVEGERILIGVTSSGISHLRSFPAKRAEVSFAAVMEEVSSDVENDGGESK